MICHASFRSSQKSFQLPHRPSGSIDWGRKDPIAAGSCNSGVRNSETTQTPSISLMKLRNERRRFKNISIYVTKLPVTPFPHCVRIPGGEKQTAKPPVPDYIRPKGGFILTSRLPKQPQRPRSPTPTQNLSDTYQRSDGALLLNLSRGRRDVTSGIRVQSGRNSDSHLVPSSSQCRVPKFDRNTEFYVFKFQQHKEEFSKLSSVMKERIIDRQTKLELKLKIYQANWLAEWSKTEQLNIARERLQKDYE